MSWLKKNKKEEFKKYVPDVSKIKNPAESVEVIDEPEVEEQVEEVKEQEEVKEEPVEEIDELEDLKRKQKEVEEKIEQAKKNKELKQTSKMMIVKELPEEPIRRYKDKDGSIVDLITIEEALGEILSILKSN